MYTIININNNFGYISDPWNNISQNTLSDSLYHHQVTSTNGWWHFVTRSSSLLFVYLCYQFTIHKDGCLVAAAVGDHPGKIYFIVHYCSADICVWVRIPFVIYPYGMFHPIIPFCYVSLLWVMWPISHLFRG